MRRSAWQWLFGVSLLGLGLGVAGLGLAGATHAADPLPGTQPLTLDRPLDEVMVDGIDRFCLNELAASREKRATRWSPDFSTVKAYLDSVEPNRVRFRTIIGAVDTRQPAVGFELVDTTFESAVVAQAKTYRVLAVRWPVLAGVHGEGLLLDPLRAPVARVVALPDADITPEMLAGLADGVPAESQFARRLAESGCHVVIPTLISRDDTHSGNPLVRFTNQPHREWVYRQAFELGRHVIGYEVLKVLAALDQFDYANANHKSDVPYLIAGSGEGGLLALYSAAADRRIDAALVSGYFAPREGVWQEPIYRNVWQLLAEFGDAELAGLIAPRPLVVEAAAAPEVAGPPAARPGRSGGAAPGRIATPGLAGVRSEVERAQPVYEKLKHSNHLKLVASGAEGVGPAGSEAALTALLKAAGLDAELVPNGVPPRDVRSEPSPAPRQARQLQELVDYTQKLLFLSYRTRDQLWSRLDRTNLDAFSSTVETYREMVYRDLIGKLPEPAIPLNARSRQVLDEPEYVGYEIVLDVYPDVIAGGILLLPKDLGTNEKRPVVVCQHGLEGVPMDTITRTGDGYQYYKAFAAELARRGFITYAPQNPYRGRDRFRTLQRKSNPLGRSLFSYIIPQHQRTLEWLKSLPNVDPQRIAFYGLSYGGKTAVRVPPMLKDYTLSICSADFNEWVSKNSSIDFPNSYMFTGEYEIFEWNMGHVANYAELAYLMAPRPFMVERGHTDGVGLDEWVAWEYAKVKRHFDFLGIGDRTEMEVFNGPHTINGQGTYSFLHRHLKWPLRQKP